MGVLDGLRQANPYSFVAPASALQNQAFGIAQGLGGQASDWMQQSASLAQGLGSYTPQQVSASTIGAAPTVSAGAVDPTGAFASLGAADPTHALSSLLGGTPTNPYLAQMNQANINQSMQGYNDALTSAANTLTRSVLPGIRSGGILAGQYGGSRQGIAEGVALGDLGTQLAQNARNLAQSAMDSGNKLYGGAYESAQDRMATTANNLAGLGVQNAQQNADRDLQAQQANASNSLDAQQYNATAQQQAAMANQQAGLQGANLNLNAAQYLGGLGQYGLNTLGELGATQQQIAQQYAQAPLTTAQAVSGMYGQLPLNLFNGSTTNRTGTTKESSFGLSLDDVARLATFATSDPRAKRDISWAGRDPLGRNVYDYNYWNDPEGTPARRGLMADETARTDPEAVGVRPDGLAAIDYGRINSKTAAALGDGVRGAPPTYDPQQRPGAIGLPTPEESAAGRRRPKPFSDPRVLMQGWTPEWSGAPRPKPFSDPSVLMKGWRPQQPKIGPLDAIDDPNAMVDALQTPQLPAPHAFSPAQPGVLGSMLLKMLQQNQRQRMGPGLRGQGLIGGTFGQLRA